jgi:hypothetical protein
LTTCVAGTNPAGPRTPRTRRASASSATSRVDRDVERRARRAERAAEPAVVDAALRFAECGAQEVAPERRFEPQRCLAIEIAGRDPARGERLDATLQPRDLHPVVGDLEDPLEAQVRVDAAALAQLVDERRIQRERARAERFVRARDRLRIRREHAGAGPRRRTPRLACVDDAHVGAAPRELASDPEADQSGADHDDHLRCFAARRRAAARPPPAASPC